MTRRAVGPMAVLGGAVVLFSAGSFGIVRDGPVAGRDGRADVPAAVVPGANRSLADRIDGLQSRVARIPRDYSAWASLGLAYVQQAKATADPAYYPKAQGVLERSWRINRTDNYVAAAGMSALASARHDFVRAQEWAERGLTINPASAPLNGALADALIQLGEYDAAFEATQRMVDLVPDTSSLARVSYAWELRGKTDLANEFMQRALENASTGTDRAFIRYYLGELAFNAGDPAVALAHHRAGLDSDPTYAANLQGKARAEAALGQLDLALADYADVVARAPEPAYVVEYGELLESVGRTAEAEEQYDLFRTISRLFEANGVAGDLDATLFEANHGRSSAAVRIGEAGVASRPFLAMLDAYAWALHVVGRDGEALQWSTKARALGTRNALFWYHAGMIERALGRLDDARRSLTTALEINPHFGPLSAPTARKALAQLVPT